MSRFNPQRTIWVQPQDATCIQVIDQRALPHEWVVASLRSSKDCATAIRDMWVRGAPLIGATAAYGMYLAVREARQTSRPEAALQQKAELLLATRPTAINLAWAIARMQKLLAAATDWEEKEALAFREAARIADEDAAACKAIGEHGLPLIEAVYRRTGKVVNILTHCNAGWLACVEWGTATSPIYHAFDAGIPVHVWVDETRPRNQGAALTAWELAQRGVPHTVITDNAGGHLMQHGQVDLCIVGSDRTTRSGDVANKIGTYLKALAAHDNGVPFFVALPSSSIDFGLRDGLAEIPIEERDPTEVTHIRGWEEARMQATTVRLTPEGSPAANYAFDVTPARLVTGLITERGVCDASEKGILDLFPENIAG